MIPIFHRKKLLNKENLLCFFILGVVFTLPFNINVNNIFVIGFLVTSLLFFKKKDFVVSLRKNRYIYWVWAWVLWNIFTLLWTEDLGQGMKVLNKQLYYFIIPFSFLSVSNSIDRILINKIFRFFIYGCLFMSVVCLVNATMRTYDYGSVNPFNEINGNFFSYINFTIFLKTHPIYFAFQVVMSIFLIVYDLYKPSSKILKHSNFQKILLGVFFVVILMLLNSFMMFFNLALLTVIFFFLLKSKLKKAVLIGLIFIPVLIASSFLKEKSKAVHIKSDLTETDFSGNQFTALKARVAKVYGTVEVIKENFWFGTGIGDSNQELIKGYEKIGFQHGVEEEYNPHNQYLTEALKSGMIGLLLFLCVILRQFKSAFDNRNIIHLFFILSMALFFLTESVLERQMGIVVFIFFTTLFLFMKENKALE